MKLKSFRKLSIILISISTLVSGCTSTAKYIAFSKAGIDYSNALNELFKCTGKVGLDSSTYRILEAKDINIDTYEKIKAVDERRIELLNSTREQALLLKRYFTLLGELANVGNTAPQSIGNDITSIANSLTSIKTKVINNSEFPTPQFNTGIGKLGEWIISEKLSGALRKELKIRERTLKESFLIHDLLLKKLIEENNNDLIIIKNILENRQVLQPILANNTTDEIFEKRQKIIGIQKLIWDLNYQKKLSENFTKVFEEIISNKTNLPRATYLSTQAIEGGAIFSKLCEYTEYKQSKSLNSIHTKLISLKN